MASSIIIYPSPLLNIHPKSLPFFACRPNPPSSLLTCSPSPGRGAVSQKSPQLWRVYAAAEDALTSETQVENAQRIVSAAGNGDEGVSTVVSSLLFVAFVGLSLLTVGVAYLAVQDFLQKREREKFEKEEAERKKKGGKKRTKVRSRSGPRGFGQRIEEEEEGDD